MFLPTHHHRSPTPSFKEGRLIYENEGADAAELSKKPDTPPSSPSSEAEEVARMLQNTDTNLDQLQDAIQRGRVQTKADQQPFLESVAQSLRGEKDRKSISQKLEALEKKAHERKNLGALKSTIEMVRGKVDQDSPAGADTQNPDAKEPSAPEQKTLLTKIGDTAEVIGGKLPGTDNLSRNQKIALGSIATLGVGVLAWYGIKKLFGWGKKSYEEGKEAATHSSGGFFKKLLIGLGIGGAAFLGLHFAVKHYKKEIEKSIQGMIPNFSLPPGGGILPASVAPIVDGAAAGAERGWAEGKEIFGDAFSAMVNHENTEKVLSEKNSYSSDTEFAGALLWAVVKDGGDFIWDEGRVALVAGGRLFALTGKFGEQAWDYLIDRNITPETTGDLVATYIAGTMVYASSLAALKLVTINKFGKNANVLWEAGLWPWYTVKRTAKSGYALVRGGVEIFDSESATRLTISRMDATFSRRTRLIPGRKLRGATADGLFVRYEFAQEQNRLLDKAKLNPMIKNNKDAFTLFEKNTDLAVDEFHRYLKGMKEADMPKEFLQALKDVTYEKDVSKLTREEVKKVLIKMSGKTPTTPSVDPPESGIGGSRSAQNSKPAESDADATEGGKKQKNVLPDEEPRLKIDPEESTSGKTSSTPTEESPTASKTKTSTPESDSAAPKNDTSDADTGGRKVDIETGEKTIEVKNATRNSESVDRILNDKEVAKALKGSTNSAEARAALQAELGTLDAAELHLIENSPAAKKIFAGAVSSGSAEIAEAGAAAKSAAKSALKGRIIGNGFGMAVDVFGLIMTKSYWDEATLKLKATDNPELKKIYESDRNYILVDAAGNAAGIMIGGYAMVTTYMSTGSILVSLGAPAGMIMAPIGLGIAAMQYARGKASESAEYHATNERDLTKKYSPGKVLEHIKKTSGGDSLNWAQDAFLPADTARLANNASREDGYRAYFAQVATARVSPLPIPLLYSDRSEQQLEGLQKQRLGQFILYAETYILNATEGTCDLVSDRILKNATTYAEMQMEKYDAYLQDPDETKRPKLLVWNYGRAQTAEYVSAWRTIRRDVADRELESVKDVALVMESMQQDPDSFAERFPKVLLENIRHELATCDQKLITADYSQWLSLDAWKAPGMGSELDLQNIARGQAAQELWNILATVAQTKTPMTSESVHRQIQQLRTVLMQSPEVLAHKGVNTKNARSLRDIGSNPTRLSVTGMLDMIDQHQFSKPTSLGSSEQVALNATNVMNHYATNVQNHMPVELRLRKGAEKGYMKLDGTWWMRTAGKRRCTRVGKDDETTVVSLEKGNLYQFYKHTTMTRQYTRGPRGGSDLIETVDNIPEKPADLEIFVEAEEQSTVSPLPKSTNPSPSAQGKPTEQAA